MRTDKTLFTCDQCSKQIGIDSSLGYPYFDGWNYIYNLEFKLTAKERKPTRDKHFCSKHCLKHYLVDLIDEKSCKEVKD